MRNIKWLAIPMIVFSLAANAADYRVPSQCRENNLDIPPPGKRVKNDPCLRDMRKGFFIFLGNDHADKYEIANCNINEELCNSEEEMLNKKLDFLKCKPEIRVYRKHFEDGSRLYSRGCKYKLPKGEASIQSVRKK